MLTNEAIIKELLEVEVWAEGLQQKCRKIRKELEGVSTSSVRTGFEPAVAKAIRDRQFRLKKKATSGND